MARIIEVDKESERQLVHDECGALIGYTLVDVKLVPKVEGVEKEIRYIICPNCGKKLYI